MAAKQIQYEGMFLLGPTGAESDAAVNLTRTLIERHGGKVLHIKKWDERKLTYEIKRQKRGTYIISFFNAPGAAVAAIERDVKLSEDFLRVMICGADHLSQKEMEAVEPQPIVREERPSWERDDRAGYRGGGGGGYRDDRG
ncbi:MAG: 30S ribosomal protein S6, partial [Tepidisphaeraceae bacterium]